MKRRFTKYKFVVRVLLAVVFALVFVTSLLIVCGLFFARDTTLISSGKNKASIPAKDASFTQKPTKVRIILTGDVMLGRSVMIEALDRKDPLFPFRKVSDRLKDADITVVNLENPIVKNCPRHIGGFTFCTTYEIAEGLVFSGVDVVSLANNHSGNYGQTGLDETVKYLENKDILVTGLGTLAVKDIRGRKFGFLGFDKSQQTYPTLSEDELGLIKKSSEEVDILIIAMHWGVEYQDRALPGVRSLAFELINNGADVIVGHHPHWVQDMECIEKPLGPSSGADTISSVRWNSFAPYENGCTAGSKPIYYSLGNFIFDQMWSEETRNGMIVELTFEDGEFVEDKFIKTYIRKVGQPEIVG